MTAPTPPASTLAPDPQRTLDAISRRWDSDILAQLIAYIRIPAKSPAFDAEWVRHGHIEAAIKLAHEWVSRQDVPRLTLEIVRLEGRTPVLFFDVPATGGLDNRNTVLLYGHLDKQPEMT